MAAKNTSDAGTSTHTGSLAALGEVKKHQWSGTIRKCVDEGKCPHPSFCLGKNDCYYLTVKQPIGSDDKLIEAVASQMERKANNNRASWDIHPETVREGWRELARVAISEVRKHDAGTGT